MTKKHNNDLISKCNEHAEAEGDIDELDAGTVVLATWHKQR